MGDESKLPKWARDELMLLRDRIADRDRRLAIALREVSERSTGKVIADCMGGKGFPLHDRAAIEFHLPNGKVTCMLRDGGTLLDINADRAMFILPRATNCAYVQIAD